MHIENKMFVSLAVAEPEMKTRPSNGTTNSTIFITVLVKLPFLHRVLIGALSQTHTSTLRQEEKERGRDAQAPRLSAPIPIMVVKTVASKPCRLCQDSSRTSDSLRSERARLWVPL